MRLTELVNGNGEPYLFAYDAEGRDHLHRETVRELGSASGSERLTERRTYDPQSRLSGFILEQGG